MELSYALLQLFGQRCCEESDEIVTAAERGLYLIKAAHLRPSIGDRAAVSRERWGLHLRRSPMVGVPQTCLRSCSKPLA